MATKAETPSKKRVSSNSGEISAARGKRLGIGTFMGEQLLAGHDTATVLANVHAKFPASRATGADVSIIRRKLRKSGHSI